MNSRISLLLKIILDKYEIEEDKFLNETNIHAVSLKKWKQKSSTLAFLIFETEHEIVTLLDNFPDFFNLGLYNTVKKYKEEYKNLNDENILKEVLKITNKTLPDFCKETGIPKTTVQTWKCNYRPSKLGKIWLINILIIEQIKKDIDVIKQYKKLKESKTLEVA